MNFYWPIARPSGEFGLTPHGQGNNGREHKIKGGLRYGATDKYGFQAIENKRHTHDWYATILHLLG